MTDNRTTELQKKLKEAGVKYTHRTQGCKTYTNWGEPMVSGAQFIDGGDWTELTVENATPEQAIAATLGSEREKALEELVRDWRACDPKCTNRSCGDCEHDEDDGCGLYRRMRELGVIA